MSQLENDDDDDDYDDDLMACRNLGIYESLVAAIS